jgi:predicted amidohydrolase
MRIAAAQLDPHLGEIANNLKACAKVVAEAAANGVELVVLPECSLSGYMFGDRSAASASAEPVPGPATEELVAACRTCGINCVVGLLEREGEDLYNTAVVLGPDGVVGRYRKSHLPILGVDRFVRSGNEPPPVFELAGARVGIEICYELRFPEVTRLLALAGAEVVLNPTNWPRNAAPLADFFIRTRAAENRVWIVAASRVGREEGATFIGRSQVVDPAGRRTAELDDSSEGLLVAGIDPRTADTKDLVFTPGSYEVHLLEDRRPELYGALGKKQR